MTLARNQKPGPSGSGGSGMKVIIYGDDIERAVRALNRAIAYEQRDGRPSGNLMGVRIDGTYWTVNWGKSSVTVRPSS